MTSRGLARAVAAAAALVLACAVPADAATTPVTAADYVVVLHESVDLDAATTRLERDSAFRASFHYRSSLQGFAARLSEEQLGRLRADPSVAYVVPDRAFQGTATAPVAARELVPPGVRRIRAATTTQAHAAADVGVAVVDTGLDLANADLNAVSGVNCVAPGTAAQDDNGHGTHVAGTLAGRNTGTGVVGVAPGTRLHAVKVLDAKANGTLSRILCGIDWLTRNARSLGIRVVNMSISGAGRNDADCGRTNNDPLHTALCASVAAGVNYVVSAGNARVDLAGTVPAAYPEVTTVTAMTDTDGLPGGKGPGSCSRREVDDTGWTSSNYAVASADAAHVVAAPGTCITSTRRGGGTTTMSGTSMAAPHVAGTVALCLGNGGVPGPCAGLTPHETTQWVRAEAERAGKGGFGFTGDPLLPSPGIVLGHLVSAVST